MNQVLKHLLSTKRFRFQRCVLFICLTNAVTVLALVMVSKFSGSLQSSGSLSHWNHFVGQLDFKIPPLRMKLLEAHNAVLAAENVSSSKQVSHLGLSFAKAVLDDVSLDGTSPQKAAADTRRKLRLLNTAVPASLSNTTRTQAPASNWLRDSPRQSSCKCPKVIDEDVDLGRLEAALKATDPIHHMTGAQTLARHHPNLPVGLLRRPQRCSLMPRAYSVAWAGRHWQEVSIGPQRLLLYSAAFDNRTSATDSPSGGVVRVLVLSHGPLTTTPTCHLWYGDQLAPVASSVVRSEHVDYQKEAKDRLLPYLLTCVVPPPAGGEGVGPHQPPVGVSLVKKSCGTASNILRVNSGHTAPTQSPVYQRPPELAGLPEVGVCGPALFYYQEDFSLRLVEWLEVLKVLGVSKVFLYVTRVHPNIEKVLAHYEQQGFVSVTDFNYPPPYVDEPLLRRLWTEKRHPHIFALENIYFTDCLVRNMHRYRFLAHFDPDEVPVLLQQPSLPHLVQHLLHSAGKNPPPGYKLQWSYMPLGVKNLEAASDVDSIARTTFSKYFTESDTHSSNLTRSYDTNASLPAPVHTDTLAPHHSTGASHRPTSAQVQADHTAGGAGARPPSSLFTILVSDRALANDTNPRHKNGKSIMDTRLATAAFSHAVFLCAAGGRCTDRSQKVGREVAVTAHFREPCEGPTCHNLQLTKQVPVLSRLRPAVVPSVLHVLNQLGLLVPN